MNAFDDLNPKEELFSCQDFLLGSDLEKVKRKVSNSAVKNLQKTVVIGKFDQLFNNLKSAAKMNLEFGFFLNNKGDGKFRFFFALEDNTLLDRPVFVCTKDDLTKPKQFLNESDVIELRSKEEMRTKSRFYKLKNLTNFAVVPKTYFWFTRTLFHANFAEKSHSQLFHTCREPKTAI